MKLVLVEGLASDKEVELSEKPILIGRNKLVCDLCILEDDKASSKHCQIGIFEDQAVVKDLNSSNGTHVNGKQIDGEQILRMGDLLIIGKTVFKVRGG